jgi:hypothetical protein
MLDFINFFPKQMVLITDGTDYHVFNPFFVDKEREMIQYQDNIGENGTCFLSRGNNSLNIDSRFIGHDKRGNWCWEISFIDFRRVFYGLPILYNRQKLWNEMADMLVLQQNDKSRT